MTTRDGRGASGARWRLPAIGALAAGVTAAIYLAGRLLQPDYTFSLFGADPIPAKSALATGALALAGLQVLLALWLYGKLPLAAAPPRPLRPVHRITGAVLFALSVPVALHCQHSQRMRGHPGDQQRRHEAEVEQQDDGQPRVRTRSDRMRPGGQMRTVWRDRPSTCPAVATAVLTSGGPVRLCP
jgi:Family of unknown function (DUF6529)